MPGLEVVRGRSFYSLVTLVCLAWSMRRRGLAVTVISAAGWLRMREVGCPAFSGQLN